MGTRKSVHTRDVLDEAVRCLALWPAEMAGRVAQAGGILTSALDRSDFPDPEDRELFERIALNVAAFGDQSPEAPALSSATVQALAGDIVDLRDGVMGRAILEAKRAQPNPEQTAA
jgi:hypothetical protein